ncbi:hypothetical protein SAMN05216302_105511 [Nitrosomonas aestuarii]|uniref:Lipoprotein n=1 Tax=Nitrosomonas aestuarii TaxID=52441 RepID=A0A1I4GHE7_9PROT|nr:hypothetical protein [Nitrosomonas aestuarii]SFL29494.1 hypothetical protein SAMN05216302_105511 [Nitrosomonas aestuarii]
MKALKYTILISMLSFTLLASCAQMSPSIVAQTEIARDDHDALRTYYETLANEAESILQKNKKIIEECEAHPYQYGAQGQDLRSHSSANIRKYEKILKESLYYADVHRKRSIEQDQPINQTEVDLELEFMGTESAHPGKEL